jgi:hypothetical protein
MVHLKSLYIPALLAALLALPLGGHAETPLPDIPKAKENANPETLCVEPVEEMRKNHMKYILHQREETLRRGIRTKQYSLKECIDCHNAPGPDGKVASVETRQHFCNSCHTYAAVKIDCFSCHADKPPGTEYRNPAASADQLKQLLNTRQASAGESASQMKASIAQGDTQ